MRYSAQYAKSAVFRCFLRDPIGPTSRRCRRAVKGGAAIKQKLLIADDSAMNRALLRDILGDTYEYVFAENGVEAVEALERDPEIDLLLLDINMPQLDGFGVLDVLEHRRWIEDVPVIIISAEDDAAFIQRAYDLGATDYISRPFNLTVVQRRVSNTLMLYARQKRLVQLVEAQVLEREKTNSAMVNILSHVIESRNGETGVHLLHVRTLTELLLRRLIATGKTAPLSEADIAMITTLSALHDIGKISIPPEILNKPGRLTPEEFEIMKRHSVVGDELLRDVPLPQDDPMLRTAHEICRWHHERWDGRGYPDGLRGSAIPISAQVVALADVYDALTSDRCYKKAFDHDTAVRMIANGECGAFDPALISCFQDIAGELKSAMQQSTAADFDYGQEARRLMSEALEQQELPQDDRVRSLLAMEHTQSEFFAERCGGIQFEYDRWLHKVIYTDWSAAPGQRRKVCYLKQDSSGQPQLLSPADWQRLSDLARHTTRQTPQMQLHVQIPADGKPTPHILNARTIWTDNAPEFTGIVGQFLAMPDAGHDSAGLPAHLHAHPPQLRAAIDQLHMLFSVVRLVDPEACRILVPQPDGGLALTDERCYSFWGRQTGCDNCSSLCALHSAHWMGKLESRGRTLYFVLSRHVSLEGRPCVLELASQLDDSASPDADISAAEGSTHLLNFYRDTLTRAYSRLYLDNFLQDLEHADGVAIMDVDRFKQINDTYGHPVGDEALRAIAAAILGRIRDSDTLIRYGGDEFLLIFPQIDEDVFYRRLSQLRDAVSRVVLDDVPELKLSISIGGVYRVAPLTEAIRQADQKMYAQKAERSDRKEPEG